MTIQQNPNAKFWDKIANKYAKTPIADEAAYQKKLLLTREHFNQNSKVLEFGCGTGSTAILHAPFVDHIEAIDISANMLAIAKQKAEEEQISNICFKQAAIDDFGASDSSFDVVLGMSILHLLEDKQEAINKVYDLLKPGGVFISSTACIGDKMGFFKFILPIGKFFSFLPLVKVFSTKQLRNSLVKGGFEINYEWKPDKAMAAVFFIVKKP
ncbi:MAG: class I SAM-dependent methyltransferase [Acidiferrobacterales bacterium]|nr:class I SAM-dependent methyltransferase [Acidiferrobacterales bacterium]